jgi:hypothetical protein
MTARTRATEATPERRLWAAVIMRAVADICGVGAGFGHSDAEVAQRLAERWLRSRDFRLVADLAGLDPDAALDRIQPILALPPEQRRAVWEAKVRAAAAYPKAREEGDEW